MRDEKIRITPDQIIISGMYPHTNGNTYHFTIEIDRDGGDHELVYATAMPKGERVTDRDIRKTLAHCAAVYFGQWCEAGLIRGQEAVGWTYRINY